MLQICLIGILLSMQIDTSTVSNHSDATIIGSTNTVIPTAVSNGLQSPDTIFAAFTTDTINFERPVPVSQVVYAEHKESPNVFYSIILPIIMLVLGVLIDRLVQVFVDRNRIKRNGERWRHELLSYGELLSKQIGSLEQFIIEYCNQPIRYDIPPLTTFQLVKGTIFESLSKEDLYIYLKRKKKYELDVQERYNKIMSFVMTLDTSYTQLNDSVHDFRESAGAQVELFNNAQLRYGKQLLCSFDPTKISNVDYNELSQLYNDAFEGHPNVNPLLMDTTLITPSLSILDSYDKQYFKVLIEELGNMRYSINGMKLEKKYIKSNLENIIDVYKICIEFLNDVNDFFPSKSLVCKTKE